MHGWMGGIIAGWTVSGMDWRMYTSDNWKKEEQMKEREKNRNKKERTHGNTDAPQVYRIFKKNHAGNICLRAITLCIVDNLNEEWREYRNSTDRNITIPFLYCACHSCNTTSVPPLQLWLILVVLQTSVKLEGAFLLSISFSPLLWNVLKWGNAKLISTFFFLTLRDACWDLKSEWGLSFYLEFLQWVYQVISFKLSHLPPSRLSLYQIQ